MIFTNIKKPPPEERNQDIWFRPPGRLRLLPRNDRRDYALRADYRQVVFPQGIGITRVGHTFHDPERDSARDLPNSGRREFLVLHDKGHTPCVAKRNNDRRPGKIPVREVECTTWTDARDFHLVGVGEVVCLAEFDAVAAEHSSQAHRAQGNRCGADDDGD